jgi:hypothetical protein
VVKACGLRSRGKHGDCLESLVEPEFKQIFAVTAPPRWKLSKPPSLAPPAVVSRLE